MLWEFCNCLQPRATRLRARSPRRRARPPRSSGASSSGGLRSGQALPESKQEAGFSAQPLMGHPFAEATAFSQHSRLGRETQKVSSESNTQAQASPPISVTPSITCLRFPPLQTGTTPSLHSLTGRVVHSCTAQYTGTGHKQLLSLRDVARLN